MPKKGGPKTDVLEALLKRVDGLEQQLKDQKSQYLPNMYRATITATWKYKGDTQERSVSELIYQP